MDDLRNTPSDDAARLLLSWQMARIRAELSFARGWKKTQALSWEKRCRQEGVRFKLPQSDAFAARVH